MNRSRTLRKRINDSVRKMLIENAGFSCCVCTESLLDYDVHHIRFVSLGGTDDPENLVPLCPNCHRTFAHRLSEVFDETQLHSIRDRWLDLKNRERAVIRYLGKNCFLEAAITILDERTRELCLLTGDYERTLLLAQEIRRGLPLRNETDRIVHSQLADFAGEMALYLGRAQEYVDPLEEAIRRLQRTQELSSVTKHAQLTLSRLYGRTGDEERKYRFYEESTPEEYGPHSDGWLEWVGRNRKNSLRNYRAINDVVQEYKDVVPDVSSARRTALLSNILAEVGYALINRGEIIEAKDILVQAVGLARHAFHRRGILVRHIRLAQTYIDLEMFSEAIDHYLLACQYRNVSAGTRLQEIRHQLVMKLEPDDLLNIWQKSLRKGRKREEKAC
jgi:tetratricopeptide (TPR) repeat protein